MASLASSVPTLPVREIAPSTKNYYRFLQTRLAQVAAVRGWIVGAPHAYCTRHEMHTDIETDHGGRKNYTCRLCLEEKMAEQLALSHEWAKDHPTMAHHSGGGAQ